MAPPPPTWPDCYNLRDLGGLPAEARRRVREGALFRSDVPSRLTDASRRRLAHLGVRTLIDLRESKSGPPDHPFGTEAGDADRPAHVNVPLPDAAPDADATKAEVYCRFVDNHRASLAAAASACANAPDGGVLIFCAAGKDRTGIVVSLLLAAAGVRRDEIAADYALSEANLSPLYEQWLANVAGDEEATARLLWIRRAAPETIRMMLDHVDARWGSAEAYLLDAGLTRAELGRIRSRLLESEPGA